jgi:hypothetical protein
MNQATQCQNCGAALGEEDIFCGECGAPHLPAAEVGESGVTEPPPAPEPDVTEPSPDLPPTPEPELPAEAKPPASSDTGWRLAIVVLGVLGALACLAGLLAFLIVGSVGGDTTTKQEDWLIAALCCLLPVGGIGLLLVAAAAVVWYTRLRSR